MIIIIIVPTQRLRGLGETIMGTLFGNTNDKVIITYLYILYYILIMIMNRRIKLCHQSKIN